MSFLLHTVLLLVTLLVPVQQLERVEITPAPSRSLRAVTLVEPPPNVLAPKPAHHERRKLPAQEPPPKLTSPVRYHVRKLDIETPAPEPIDAPPPELAVGAPGPRPLPPIEPPAVQNLEPPVRTGLLHEPALDAVEPSRRKLTVRRGQFSSAESRKSAEPLDETVQVAGFNVAALTEPGENSGENSNARRITDADFGRIEVKFSHSGGAAPEHATAASRFESAKVEPQAPADNSPVHKGSFAEIVSQQPLERPAESKSKEQAGPVEGVRILEKPRPAYTAEARRRRVEGDVLLEVLFKASGTVEILRLIEGLGHGLDANALEAARKLRFQPARRGGKPIDSRAIVTISFQLAY